MRANIPCITRIVCVSGALVTLTACAAFHTADNELDTASRQVATQDMTLTAKADSVPKAAITPRGDFLVAGKPVAMTPDQRKELLAYRAQYVAIAQQAIAIAHEGVDVGKRAMVPMMFAALFGASNKTIDARMNERLAGVRKDTAKLCDRLPRLKAAQDQLAADLPAFKPYATLTPRKVDECRDGALKSLNVADN